MVDALKQVRESLQVNINLKRDTPSHALIERLAKCIDKGFETAKESFEEIRKRVKDIRAVEKTLDPRTGNSAEREETFEILSNSFGQQDDSVSQHMAGIMKRFKPEGPTKMLALDAHLSHP